MRLKYYIFILVTVSFILTTSAQVKRDISFTIVDTPPRYPGCKGGNIAFLKECFRNKVESLIADNFDFKQFEKTISKGDHRVFVTFRILEDGTIDQLDIRTPYNSIEKETLRVLADIPLFEPALHNEKPRNTLFATAFTVSVKEGKPFVKDTSAAARNRPRYIKTGYNN